MEAFSMVSMVFVVSGVLSAIIIFSDEYVFKNRQPMQIMNLVWVLTGLWAGVIGLVAYYKIGRNKRGVSAGMNSDALHHHKMSEMNHSNPVKAMSEGQRMQMPAMEVTHHAEEMRMPGMDGTHHTEMMQMPGMEVAHHAEKMQMPGMVMPERKMWEKTALSTLHCGAGCTLADITGEWFLFFMPLAIGWGWMLDYLLALVAGLWFQSAAIREMEPALKPKQIFHKALKVDFWSLTAWQIGMYGLIAVAVFGFGFSLERNTWAFWFLMQVAMGCGFLTAYPVNRMLIRRGIKKGM